MSYSLDKHQINIQKKYDCQLQFKEYDWLCKQQWVLLSLKKIQDMMQK